MRQQQTQPTGAAARVPTQRRATPPQEPTVWAGWVLFGAMMMILLGAFQAIAGLVALFDDGYYAVNSDGLLVHVSYTAWGWVHLGLGVIALAAGFGLMRGAMWARILGVGVAMVSAIVNLGFLAAFPLWAITMIALDVVVIYAITAHGSEVRDAVS
ncbi:hypothetical protein H9L09_11870 [Nocardioides mesophilus]|uniref:DUF7144 domain-containing protein n=2 Tax=Nocardioides mesophilus TaxID=433659 RepID=A0A7G9RHD4_9ACTN|nr:hypothetical protein H9L09_11870 [Nocardioides mesophilus]